MENMHLDENEYNAVSTLTLRVLILIEQTLWRCINETSTFV